MLKLHNNPLSYHDYIIEHFYESSEMNIMLNFVYVPDTECIDPYAFKDYISQINFSNENMAQNAQQILEYFNNLFLPRYVRLEIVYESMCRLVVEELRPGWHNEFLLQRMGTYLKNK